MNPALLAAIVQQSVIPELLNFIRQHHATTGELPTDEQVIAKFNLDVDAAIAKGEAFLAS